MDQFDQIRPSARVLDRGGVQRNGFASTPIAIGQRIKWCRLADQLACFILDPDHLLDVRIDAQANGLAGELERHLKASALVGHRAILAHQTADAMQEQRVTASGRTWPLEPPFLVFATQNPIEYEGTFPLPEAQLDRFLFKLKLGYLPAAEEDAMLVSEILRIKGNALFTAAPGDSVRHAVGVMAHHDIGSLVVMDRGALVGMLSFREVIQAVVKNGGSVGTSTIRGVMDDHPLTCTPETELDEVRRMMLERHARYMPVMDQRTLMGVISFYDVAKAVVESQDFENRMLKAYIRDWPVDEAGAQPAAN